MFGGTGSREVIDEFAQWTADEVDYLVEARQAVLLHDHAKGDRFEHIARVYRDYTTSRVLTTELIEGIPLIEVMIARRDGDQAYLDAFAAAGHDLDKIVRRLDWNMLNQVFVFGFFHADLHPANIFVLPGDAIGYVDFGIVGQLPNRIRQSLTRYSWLLFRGEIEAAVTELMRWLAPTSQTDESAARWRLIRIHQTFLYDATADRSRMTSEAPGPIVASRENPYSKLAVDILETVRDHRLSMSPNIVGYLKMLVTLGALRHQLAVDYDLPDTVRRFVRRLARQQSLSLLDPRLAMERLYAGGDPGPAGAPLRGLPRGPGADDPRGGVAAVRLPAQDAERSEGPRAARRHGPGAIEWYFAPQGSLYSTVFYKGVNNYFIRGAQAQSTFRSLRLAGQHDDQWRQGSHQGLRGGLFAVL